MHIEDDDLYGLADAELHSILLTDAQSRQKQHLGECRECYERYCVYITMLDLTGCVFLTDVDSEETDIITEEKSENDEMIYERMKDVILQIRLAGAFIESVWTNRNDNASYWTFINRAASARSRGNGIKTDIYTSMKSEQSQIRKEGQKLIIQLDEEIFPVELLGVRYEENGRSAIRRFVYNDDTECYEVIIDRCGQTDDIMVEVVWL